VDVLLVTMAILSLIYVWLLVLPHTLEVLSLTGHAFRYALLHIMVKIKQEIKFV